MVYEPINYLHLEVPVWFLPVSGQNILRHLNPIRLPSPYTLENKTLYLADKKNVKVQVDSEKHSGYFLIWSNRDVDLGPALYEEIIIKKMIGTGTDNGNKSQGIPIPYTNATQKSVLRIQNHPLRIRIHAFCFNPDPDLPLPFRIQTQILLQKMVKIYIKKK